MNRVTGCIWECLHCGEDLIIRNSDPTCLFKHVALDCVAAPDDAIAQSLSIYQDMAKQSPEFKAQVLQQMCEPDPIPA